MSVNVCIYRYVVLIFVWCGMNGSMGWYGRMGKEWKDSS